MNVFPSGLIAAPFTPFRDDGTLRLELIPQLADRLVEDQVKGAFIGGTTGEFSSLAIDERERLNRTWVEAARSRGLRALVHVGSNSIEDSRRLASHAASLEADGISAVAPSYFRPDTVESLVGYCASIAEAAPELPFFYYHIPGMTGVHLSCSSFLTQAASRIPNLKGLKYSHNDFVEVQRCLNEFQNQFEILWGYDEGLLAGLAFGAHGAVGSTYNYLGPHYRQIVDRFASGDLPTARRMQAKVARLVASFGDHGGLAANKAVMAELGIDCGPCRPPNGAVTGSQRRRLHELLTDLGFSR